MKRKLESRVWAPSSKRSEEEIERSEHFATRVRDNDFVRLMRTLPDPDPILRKMGKGITALKALLTDSHLESVWSVRCAAVSGEDYCITPGDDSAAAQAAADAFAKELAGMNVPQIIEEMMDAIAYGYSPLEVLWEAKDGHWGISDIVGKPPQWFEFSSDNTLVLKTGIAGAEELPENRFLLVQHRPSYANPYGVKAFSKCFWPVTFKKNGFRWWTVFIEKYGGAFMYGKYPMNAGENYKQELLAALEQMVANAVAIAPEGAEITIDSVADKKGGSDVHAAYIAAANAEISKAILGQTLTTEVGDVGSYAASNTHNLVRKDIATADRRRVSAAFGRLAAIYTYYNYGPTVAAPLFQFIADEDLQSDRAARDMQLYQIGWRPRKSYFIREYGMQEDDFDLYAEPNNTDFPGFAEGFPRHEHEAGCSCGCGSTPKKRSLFHRLAMFFASKEEKDRDRDRGLLERFDDSILRAAQQETDATVDAFAIGIEKARKLDDVVDALGLAYNRLDTAQCASLLNEIRYASSQIGAASGKKGGKRHG